MKQVIPVQLLFHGTAFDYSDTIERQGLLNQNYDKVYLTSDLYVAYEYALMRTRSLQSNSLQPVICVVDAPQMAKDGFVFTHDVSTAEYTVDKVPPHYILQVVIEGEADLDQLARYVKEVSCLC